MNRRQFLAAATGATMTALAGCSGLTGGPKYDPDNREALLPDAPAEDGPDDDLESRPEDNENFARVWVTSDEDVVVMYDVKIHETVEAAKEGFQSSKATQSSPNDYPLAAEAIIASGDQVARCYFRDSNAVGTVLAGRFSGLQLVPDRERAVAYAEEIYAEWPSDK